MATSLAVAAITIIEAERRELLRRAGQYTRPCREVIRAKIELLAADGLSDQEIAEVKALACELPAQTGRPLSLRSAAELARQAVQRGIVCEVSGTTVWRWLAEDAIRPWAWRS